MQVTKSECEEMRRTVRETETILTELSEEMEFGKTTLHNHLSGKCSHNLDVEPLDRVEMNSNVTITPDECSLMRHKFRSDGDTSFADLTDEFDVSDAAINHHIRGNCSCDNETEPVEKTLDYSQVSKESCETIRGLYEEIGSLEEVARRVGRDYTTVRHHAKALCPHVDEDIVTVSYEHLTSDMCDDLVDDLISGMSISEVVDKYGVVRKTIVKHARANCQCRDGPVLLEVRDKDMVLGRDTNMSKGECLRAMELYWEEHKHAEDIAQMMGFTRQVVSHHITQECDHEFEDDTRYVFI